MKSVSGACLVTLNQPTEVAITGPDQSFKIDNAIARSVTDGTTTNGSTTITSNRANFTAADVGLSVGGTNIPGGTTLVAPCSGTTCALSTPATASEAGTATLTFGGSLQVSSTRQVNDANNSSATVIHSTAAKWTSNDVGLPVYGPGIPPNTYILSVAGANVTTTGGLTLNAKSQTIVIGDPTGTAPQSADQAAYQGVQLDLNPALVPGSEPCSAESAEGLATVARWNNPGSFTGSALFNTQPAGTKAIGQMYFDTAVTSFSAFVIETNNPLGPGAFTYSLHFPKVPTAMALCPSTVSSPGVGFSLSVQGTTLSQSALPLGTGRPGTGQLRALLPSTSGYATSATVVSDDPLVTFTPAGDFTRLCVYPAPPNPVSFKCGNG